MDASFWVMFRGGTMRASLRIGISGSRRSSPMADVIGVYVRPGDRTMPFMLPADGMYLHDSVAAPAAAQWDGLLFVGQRAANVERVTRGPAPAPIAPGGLSVPAVAPAAAGVGVGAAAGAFVPAVARAAGAAAEGLAALAAAAGVVGGLGVAVDPPPL